MLGLALIALLPAAVAKTVYIRDELYVPLRGGQSSEYRILHKGIKSGTPLELLQTNEDTGYSRVRMKDGLEGWLQTQYIQDEPVAADKLKAVQEKLTALQAEHQQTLLQNNELQSERDKLQAELNDTTDKLDKTATQLTNLQQTSANVIKINERNKSLEAERQEMQKQIDSLMAENDKLQDHAMQMWFIRGGGVVLVAVILGFLFGRRIYNRRESGWWA